MGRHVLITSQTIGADDAELGRILMRSFLASLAKNDPPPATVMLANEGVRLACEGSEVLDSLQQLADRGVRVAACQTCLKHLGLTEEFVVGSQGEMSSLVAAVCSDGLVTIG